MNESGFTASIGRKLPADIYALKLNLKFATGVADSWYSGRKKDLWVEWKYLHKLCRMNLPKLSPRQLSWLNDRYDEGRDVAVIIGSPQGCLLFTDKEWNLPKPKSAAITKQACIDWIIKKVSL